MPLARRDAGVDPGHKADTGSVEAANEVQAGSEHLLGGHAHPVHNRLDRGWRHLHQERVHADGGGHRDAAACQGRNRLVAGLPETPVRDTAAVLDAVNAYRDRLLHRGRAVRMCRDRQARFVDAIHDQPQLIGRELGEHHVAARGVDAPRGHHLDDVHAPLDPLGNGADDLLSAEDLTTQEETMPGLDRQWWPGGDDGGLGCGGGVAGPCAGPR